MGIHFYRLYGLIIRSEHQLKHLNKISERNHIDLHITFRKINNIANIVTSNKGRMLKSNYGRVENRQVRFEVWQRNESEHYLTILYEQAQGGVLYHIDKEASRMTVHYTDSLPFNDIESHLIGPVIGCVLRLRGIVCLHAGVVSIGERAIAFIGNKGAGKSTMMAFLSMAGFPILSDDIATLILKDEHFYVDAGYPRLRLWQQTIDMMESEVSVEKVSKVLSYTDKFYVRLNDGTCGKALRFEQDAQQISNIYFLCDRNSDGLLKVNSLKGKDAYIHLLQNIYVPYMVEGSLLIKEYQMLSQLANNIPVKQLERPNDISQMDKVCEMINRDIQSEDLH